MLLWLVIALFVAVGSETVLKPQSYVVPNIVHQVYDYKNPSYFLYLSLKCVQFYLKPERHILWVNNEGRFRMGLWYNWMEKATPGSWEFDLKQMIEKNVVEAKFIQFPLYPPDNSTLYVPGHAYRSDFVRIQALLDYGGIYLDTDAFPIQNFDEFRHMHFTFSLNNEVVPLTDPIRINNGVMLASPNSSFVKVWMKNYSNYGGYDWDHHWAIPFLLVVQHPDLVHMEMYRLAPISYGLQTAQAAQFLTCGLLIPEEEAIWGPRFDTEKNSYTFEGTTPNKYLYKMMREKLVLHMTMSSERYYCLLRRSLNDAEHVGLLPSLLGHYLRRALHDHDHYDYSKFTAKNMTNEIRLQYWNECRSRLGMMYVPERESYRQQFMSPIK